ncbi:hypothetical protein ACOSQ3_005233 [Xanthoceras sorbifolium]
MTTRGKDEIFIPKFYSSIALDPTVSIPLHLVEPSAVKTSLHIPEWKKAMDIEYEALHRNQTWALVPYSASFNVVSYKWVFKLKLNPNGSVACYKACLVAKNFIRLQVLILKKRLV